MKNTIKNGLSIIILILLVNTSNIIIAQNVIDGKAHADIKTSAVCGSCKKTIESALKKLDGVQSASLDLSTKIVSVDYSVEAVSLQQIKKTITEVGYDADEMPAVEDAYDHLDGCCKKE
ncbi:MAG: heavy-metal-associated domain-containing protein [Chitinophagales bacterium]